MSKALDNQEKSEFYIEEAAIDARRATYNIDKKADKIGLALSGGGIRSATFALGLLQELSRQKLLQKLDYLSTVSGGGYMGAFYTGLFAKRDSKAGAEKVEAVLSPQADVDMLASDDAKAAIGYLRQSGRYMTPAGARDLVMALALLVRNWLTLTMVMGAALMLLTLGMDWLRDCVSNYLSTNHGAFAIQLVPGLKGLESFLNTKITYQGLLRASPLMGLLPLFLAMSLASGWSYWLTMSNVARQWWRPVLMGTLAILVGAFLVVTHGHVSGIYIYLAWYVTGISALALALASLAWIFTRLTEGALKVDKAQSLQAIRQDQIRLRLTIWQGHMALASLSLVAVIIADGATLLVPLLQSSLGTQGALGTAALSTLLVPVAQQLVKFLVGNAKVGSVKDDGAKPKNAVSSKPSIFARLAPMLAGVIALILGVAALAFWGGLAHLVAWGGGGWITVTSVRLSPLYWTVLPIMCVFVALCATTQSFVNLSSLSTFYASRLRRAYLGAGNRTRLGNGKGAIAVQDGDLGDDLGLVEYYKRTQHGAPVHIINVTINETRGQGAQTVQQDRHGLNLAISPQGLCWTGGDMQTMESKPLGSQIKTKYESPVGQSLPVSAWVGISGAAFSTGMGGVTNIAYAILMFLSNIRLGYWWLADRAQWFGGLVYTSLFRELTANFPGPQGRHWYLSDGGHFENTAVYELVRRKLPFIITSDNGADPGNELVDIANLVRKCRIDFDAEVRFLSRVDLQNRFGNTDLEKYFTTPDELLNGKAHALACGMLARIGYNDGSKGTLLVVKPRLSLEIPHDIPTDVARYKLENRSFPQQTTFDQFFDEAQWESYRTLGQVIGRRLFDPIEGVKWQPHDMVMME